MTGDAYICLEDVPSKKDPKYFYFFKGDIIYQYSDQEHPMYVLGADKKSKGNVRQVPRKYLRLLEEEELERFLKDKKPKKVKTEISYHKTPNEKAPIIKNKEAKIRLEGTKDWLKNPPLIHKSNIFILPSKETLIKQVMTKEEDGWRVFWIHENPINIFRSDISVVSIEEEPVELSSEEEVEEMFRDLEDALDKNEQYKPVDEQSFQILFGWQPGMTFEASPAWTLFRCRAATPERIQKFVHACQMIVSGLHSARAVHRETGWSINTVTRLIKKILTLKQKMGLGDILCPCGQPIITHKGWCSYRFSKSEARKETIKKLTTPTPKENNEEKEKKESFEKLNYENLESETIEYVHPLEENIDAIEITPSKKWPKRVAKLDEDQAKQIRIFILMNPGLSEKKVSENFAISQATIQLLKRGGIYRDAIPTKEDILALQSPKEIKREWLIPGDKWNEICFGDDKHSGDAYCEWLPEAGKISHYAALQDLGFARFAWDYERPDCPYCRVIGTHPHYEVSEKYTCDNCKKEYTILTGTYIENTTWTIPQIWRFAWLIKQEIDHPWIISEDIGVSIEEVEKMIKLVSDISKLFPSHLESRHQIFQTILGPINEEEGIWITKHKIKPGNDLPYKDDSQS